MAELPPVKGIIFLGNPGRQYEATRHNVGFRVADHWLAGRKTVWQSKFKGLWTSVTVGTRSVHLVKPLTFMNLVGESARAVSDFFKAPPDAWIAVHDDIELPFGEVRFQSGGGLGGHKGLRSLKDHWGTPEFRRLRIGVGRPTRGDVATFVLQPFTSDEEIELTRILDRACRDLDQAVQGP